MNNKNWNFIYAVRDNELVCIDDVDSGLSCSCTCPACNGKLVARKGNKNAHHFAHHSSDCGKGYETSLHLLAKEILSETNEIFLPPVYIETASCCPNMILFPAMKVEIDSAELEKKTDDIIPDVIVTSGNRQLIIEIRVTHKVDDTKLEKIKNTGISALEVDLSRYDRAISKSELRNILINSNKSKKWLYDDTQKRYSKALYDFSEEKPADSFNKEMAYDCPLEKKAYVDFDKCLHCEYLVKINRDEFGNLKSIRCSGKDRISTIEDIIQTIKKYCK